MADDQTPTATDTAERGEDIALQRAAAIVAAAANDPIALAQQFVDWQNAVKGAHAVLHAVVRKYVGAGVAVVIPRADWQAIDPAEELLISTDANGDANLIIRMKNRAERRAAQRH